MHYMPNGKRIKVCMKTACMVGAVMVGFKLGYMVCRNKVIMALGL